MNSLFSPLIQDFDASLAGWAVPERLGVLDPPAPVPLPWDCARQAGVSVEVWPLDRVHEVISGNKWFKLKYNLLSALENGCSRIASCGGAYSNHLHALAWAGRELGLPTWAAIRGEELALQQNATLNDLRDWGMCLTFVSRERYRQWRAQGWAFFPTDNTLNVPEGGDNFLGVLGCISLAQAVSSRDYTQVHLACGTGCTFLGMRLGLPVRMAVTGWCTLKGNWQSQVMQQRLQHYSMGAPTGKWQLLSVGDQRRFGHRDTALSTFMQTFTAETGILLDPVYTGRMLWGLQQQLLQGKVAPGSRLLVIHSGGLQGQRAQADQLQNG